MQNVFQSYAQFYDTIYADKNYAKECDFLEHLIHTHRGDRSREEVRLLDVSCGTGKHAHMMAKRGYQVTATDFAEPMLEQARQHSEPAGVKINFLNPSSMHTLKVEYKQDVIITLFGSICYLLNRIDIEQFFANSYNNLNSGGLLIFDFYNATEAPLNFEPLREKTWKLGDLRLTRTSRTSDDFSAGCLNIEFAWEIHQGIILEAQGKEMHKMRYAMLREMRELCQSHGFQVVRECPFLEPENPPQKSTWNITLVAQKP